MAKRRLFDPEFREGAVRTVRGSRSLRMSTQVDGSCRPPAQAASGSCGLLLGLQLLRCLRCCGAVHAR